VVAVSRLVEDDRVRRLQGGLTAAGMADCADCAAGRPEEAARSPRIIVPSAALRKFLAGYRSA
jgi:hypothetical protein